MSNKRNRLTITWRRERDSNPRNPSGFSGFQDHRHRPLGHPSASNIWPHSRDPPRRRPPNRVSVTLSVTLGTKRDTAGPKAEESGVTFSRKDSSNTPIRFWAVPRLIVWLF